ncbi:hypothetical protein D3C78_1425010 [compost metagenome]
MGHAGRASCDRHDTFLTGGFSRFDGCRGRCLIGFRFGHRLRQEGFRLTHRMRHVTHINPFAVQRGISRYSLPCHHHQFSLSG